MARSRSRRPVVVARKIIRIVVADGHPIDRRGIALLLSTQPDFAVVAEAASAAEVVDRCRTLAPHVAVLDTHLVHEPEPSLIDAVRAVSADTGVVVVASRGEDHCVILERSRRAPVSSGLRVLSAAGGGQAARCSDGTDCLTLGVLRGARAAIRRSEEPEILFRAVREVASGHAWFGPAIAARVEDRRAASSIRLTAREQEVAALVVDGRSNKEIGRSLGIGEATVKRHVGHLFRKLGVLDRLQLGLHLARNPQLVSGSEPRTARAAHR